MWCTCWFAVGVDAARTIHHPRSPPSVLGRDSSGGHIVRRRPFSAAATTSTCPYLHAVVCLLHGGGRPSRRGGPCEVLYVPPPPPPHSAPRRRRTHPENDRRLFTPPSCIHHGCGRWPHARPLAHGRFQPFDLDQKHRDPSPRRSFTTFHSAQTCPPWWLQDWQNRAPQWPSHRV